MTEREKAEFKMQCMTIALDILKSNVEEFTEQDLIEVTQDIYSYLMN